MQYNYIILVLVGLRQHGILHITLLKQPVGGSKLIPDNLIDQSVVAQSAVARLSLIAKDEN
jgi:hypothetical protein